MKIGKDAALQALPTIKNIIEAQENTLRKFFHYIIPHHTEKNIKVAISSHNSLPLH
jgi:hypothetical protein